MSLGCPDPLRDMSWWWVGWLPSQTHTHIIDCIEIYSCSNTHTDTVTQYGLFDQAVWLGFRFCYCRDNKRVSDTVDTFMTTATVLMIASGRSYDQKNSLDGNLFRCALTGCHISWMMWSRGSTIVDGTWGPGSCTAVFHAHKQCWYPWQHCIVMHNVWWF